MSGRRAAAGALLAVLWCIAGAMQSGHAAPLPGQIIPDPDHPQWLKRQDGGPFFLCGPGDPEDFLYRGSRNPNGTRTGDQDALIARISGTGANSIYFEALRTFGDGAADHNPFIGSNTDGSLDQDILDQWETWFTELDANGIVIYFFFYDDSTSVANDLNWPLDGSGNLHSQERYFIETLVNRFEHHKNLVWVPGEEAQEMGPDYVEHTNKIAQTIRQADNHNHAIAVHKLTGINFSEFAGNPDIDQFAIQNNDGPGAGFLHDWMVQAWDIAAGRYNLNMSEVRNHGTGATARKKNWAIAMGGAYVMALGWDIKNTPLATLRECGYLVDFMESTRFNAMAPHDELRHGGSEYVLADPGTSYIAYAWSLAGDMGLKAMSAGNYNFTWFDALTGNRVNQLGVSVSAGDQTWSRPNGIGAELAVYITVVAETIPPLVSAVVSQPLSTAAVVTWSTDERATALVSYGTTPALGMQRSATGSAMSHVVTVSGLGPDTLYYFTVTSVDGSGNETTDDNGGALYSFRTWPEVGDNSLIYYPLDEGLGQLAADASANGNDGIINGNATWIPGRFGSGLALDGAGAYIDTGVTTQLAEWTLAVWTRSPAAPTSGPANGVIHREDNFVLSWNHPATTFQGAAALSVGGQWHAASFGPLAADIWYHLAATYDGETLKAYRDGVLMTANTGPSGPPDPESAPLTIGRHAQAANYFTGDIDEVRIYARVLDETEIANLHLLNPDVRSPVIGQITTAPAGPVVSTAVVTIAGTATDSGRGDSGIAGVTVNGLPADNGTASGSAIANWSLDVILTPGANAITVVATDGGSASNQSTEITAITWQPIPDGDFDGLPDVWENANGTNQLVDDAADDPDSDGISNLDEFRAGTDPQNPLSGPEGATGVNYVLFRDHFDDAVFADRWYRGGMEPGPGYSLAESGTELTATVLVPASDCDALRVDSLAVADASGLVSLVYRAVFRSDAYGKTALGLTGDADRDNRVEVVFDTGATPWALIRSVANAVVTNIPIDDLSAPLQGVPVDLRIARNGDRFDVFINQVHRGNVTNPGIGASNLQPYIEVTSCTADAGFASAGVDLIELLLDRDADGLADTYEDSDANGVVGDDESDPLNPDSDADTFVDGFDNCPVIGNPAQTDTDGDSLGDACDTDDDNDGVLDIHDQYPLDPLQSGIRGDIDGGGSVDIQDLLLLQQALTRQLALDSRQQYRADVFPAVNGDGILNVSDLLELQRTLLVQ